MYKESRITFKNALSLLEESIGVMRGDLKKYQESPKYNERFAHFKKAQIENLEAVYFSFLEFQDDANLEILGLMEKIQKEKEQQTKLQGALLIHGASLGQIGIYLNSKITAIQTEVAYIYKDVLTPQNIKVAKKPLIPFRYLKEKALTGTCSDKTITLKIAKRD